MDIFDILIILGFIAIVVSQLWLLGPHLFNKKTTKFEDDFQAIEEDLQVLSKKKKSIIEVYARERFGVQLDVKQTKAKMIDQLREELDVR